VQRFNLAARSAMAGVSAILSAERRGRSADAERAFARSWLAV